MIFLLHEQIIKLSRNFSRNFWFAPRSLFQIVLLLKSFNYLFLFIFTNYGYLKSWLRSETRVLDAFYTGMRILGEFSARLIYHPLSHLVCVAEWKLFTRWSQFIAVRCPQGTCLSERCAAHRKLSKSLLLFVAVIP